MNEHGRVVARCGVQMAGSMVSSLGDGFRALTKSKAYPKAFRDWASMVTIPSEDDRPLMLAQAVVDLRALAQRFPQQAASLTPFLGALERRAMDRHMALGATTEEALAAVDRYVRGGWVEQVDDRSIYNFPYPEVVDGGFMGTESEAADLAETGEPGSRAMFTLNGGRTDTPWTRFLDHHSPHLRPRLVIVRRVLEGLHLVGARAPGGSWCDDHRFMFCDHAPLQLTWRAWGDVQAAMSGKGHYMQWYF